MNYFFIVKLWTDPYNERGEYHETIQYYKNKAEALETAMNASERSIVLDTKKSANPGKVIYSRGFN